MTRKSVFLNFTYIVIKKKKTLNNFKASRLHTRLFQRIKKKIYSLNTHIKGKLQLQIKLENNIRPTTFK